MIRIGKPIFRKKARVENFYPYQIMLDELKTQARKVEQWYQDGLMDWSLYQDNLLHIDKKLDDIEMDLFYKGEFYGKRFKRF